MKTDRGEPSILRPQDDLLKATLISCLYPDWRTPIDPKLVMQFEDCLFERNIRHKLGASISVHWQEATVMSRLFILDRHVLCPSWWSAVRDLYGGSTENPTCVSYLCLALMRIDDTLVWSIFSYRVCRTTVGWTNQSRTAWTVIFVLPNDFWWYFVRRANFLLHGT